METDRLDYYERLLRMKPVIERLFTIAESKIKQSIESGSDSKFFKLTKGRRNRVWAESPDVLAAVLGDAIYAKPELLSPAAAEKVFEADQLNGLIRWAEGATQLKPRSDIKNEISVNASEFN